MAGLAAIISFAAEVIADCMMPNIDPRALKDMMARMGIKMTEIEAIRVVIETPTSRITIANPQVTKTEGKGSYSFQVTGEAVEEDKTGAATITEDDIRMVSERTGVTDSDAVRSALQNANGDIAQAILDLKGG